MLTWQFTQQQGRRNLFKRSYLLTSHLQRPSSPAAGDFIVRSIKLTESTVIDYIAWWGAGLSTLLAFVKLWELWRDRFRIDIGCNLTSKPEIGNEIFIRNLSANPIILSYWELLHCSGVWPFRKLSEFESSGPDASDIKIEPHSSKAFSFSEAYHFGWTPKSLQGRKIYMRLYVVGRRAVLKKVYG